MCRSGSSGFIRSRLCGMHPQLQRVGARPFYLEGRLQCCKLCSSGSSARVCSGLCSCQLLPDLRQLLDNAGTDAAARPAATTAARVLVCLGFGSACTGLSSHSPSLRRRSSFPRSGGSSLCSCSALLARSQVSACRAQGPFNRGEGVQVRTRLSI